ncbi:MAG TPA: glycosyltransferase family 4 protein [Steroidobacteraceae bacterium]
MRLLFVNYEFPPLGGGAAYASLAMAREFLVLGHHVDFLTAGFGRDHGDAQIDGIRVYRVPSHRSGVHESGLIGVLSFLASAARRLRELASTNNYDVYHYYFSLPTGLLSLLPGAHRRRPYVVSLRGSDVPGYDSALKWQHRALLPITRRIWRGAHRVVTNSANLRQLAHACVPDIAIDVILNGTYMPTGFVPSEPRAGLRILVVSRLIERKGIDTLIMALGRSGNENLSLDVAGDGPQARALQRLAHVCGVAERVRFHGFVDRAGLTSLYAGTDIFVLASLAESCSMALLEAMGMGLPVIATRVGGTVELVENGINGLLFTAQNVEELAAALRTLAANPALRERFAAANRALSARQFSWRAAALRYEAIFRCAMGEDVPAERHEAELRQGPAPRLDRVSE